MKTQIKTIFIYIFFSAFLLPSSELSWYFGPAAADDTNGIYYNLLDYLDKTEESLYAAIHELELIQAAQKIVELHRRGVQVEIILEKRWAHYPENLAALMILTNAGVRVIMDKRTSGLMHNKYLISDRNKVWTGSVNLTMTGMFRNYNDAVIIRNKRLARCYLEDYFRVRNPKRSASGSIYRARPIRLGDSGSVRAFFSLSGYRAGVPISDAVRECRDRLSFMIFAFSSREICFAMQDRYFKGAEISGIFDNSFESENILKTWKTVPFQVLWKIGADVRYDNEKAKVHHKCIMIDGKKVITGSFNFSKNADKNNNENFVVIENPPMARAYEARFKTLKKKFPEQTEFESWVIATNRGLSSLSWPDYRSNQYRQKYLTLSKNIKSGNLKGRIIEVYAGDLFLLKEKTSGMSVMVKLAGIDAPESGFHHLNQEPQASYSRQHLWLTCAGYELELAIKDKSESGVLHCLVHLAGSDTSVNLAMLKNGMAYLEDSEIFPASLAEYRPLMERYFILALDRGLGLHSPELIPERMPADFRYKLDDWKLGKAEIETRNSLTAWREDCLIGNRRTYKFYLPGTSRYMEYLKDLDNPRLIFFAGPDEAGICGYSEGGI